jgi:hypothetical protein
MPRSKQGRLDSSRFQTVTFGGFKTSILQMRSIIFFLFVIAMPFLVLAEDSPLDSLPQAVRETIDMEKGDGVVKSAESYDWGDVTIFKVEIDMDGVPALELQIAGNGKLIRVDDLRVEKEDDTSG